MVAEQGQGHSGEANQGQQSQGQHGHDDGRAKVKSAVALHTSKKDRYMAAMNGILDNAKIVVMSGISPTEMASKVEELRGSLDEIWSEIHTHEK